MILLHLDMATTRVSKGECNVTVMKHYSLHELKHCKFIEAFAE